jgi:hypothetical protein
MPLCGNDRNDTDTGMDFNRHGSESDQVAPMLVTVSCALGLLVRAAQGTLAGQIQGGFVVDATFSATD